jgi:hypothetical protein
MLAMLDFAVLCFSVGICQGWDRGTGSVWYGTYCTRYGGTDLHRREKNGKGDVR